MNSWYSEGLYYSDNGIDLMREIKLKYKLDVLLTTKFKSFINKEITVSPSINQLEKLNSTDLKLIKMVISDHIDDIRLMCKHSSKTTAFAQLLIDYDIEMTKDLKFEVFEACLMEEGYLKNSRCSVAKSIVDIVKSLAIKLNIDDATMKLAKSAYQSRKQKKINKTNKT
jgi:hypothetical protein